MIGHVHTSYMNKKKYKEYLADTYKPKVYYAIRVLNSCENKDQLKSCINWMLGLYNDWLFFEGGRGNTLDRTSDDYLGFLMDMFTESFKRKASELGIELENNVAEA